jgi:chromosome segregation ATPase
MKLKKILLVGGIATVGLFLVGGVGVVKKQISYAKQHFQQWADENTDPDQEIKRLKGELDQLDAQEKKIKDALAKEIHLSEKLTEEKKDLEAKLPAEEQMVRDLHAAIKASDDSKKVSVGKTTFKMDEALKKLDAETKAVSARQKQLVAVSGELDRHNEFRAVLRSQLDELRASRRELASELDTLALEFRTLELQGMKTKSTTDNNKLSEMRASIKKLKDRAAEQKIRNGLDTEDKAADAPTALDADKMIERIGK